MRIVRSATLVCLVLVLAGCSLRGRTEKFEAQVELFHELYSDENLSGLVGLTAPEFHRTSDTESFFSLMRSVQDRLGDTERSELKAWNLDHLPERRLTLIYQTRFERGEGTEMFTFDFGDPPRLINYNISISLVQPK